MMMDKIALTLLIIGGLNWGSVGLFQFDLVAFACGGSGSMISRVIYTLVGLSAVWCVSLLFRDRDGAERFKRWRPGAYAPGLSCTFEAVWPPQWRGKLPGRARGQKISFTMLCFAGVSPIKIIQKDFL